MNDGQIERLLRHADQSLARVSPNAAAVLAARVRERAAVRAVRRRRTIVVSATIGMVAAAGLFMVVMRSDPGAPPMIQNDAPAMAESSLRLIAQRSDRDAELASMVVRELRTRRDADARTGRSLARDPVDVAVVEAEQAANVLLAQVRTFADTPALREAVAWRCELIITAFPASTAATEARAVLNSSGRSDGGSLLVRREPRGAQRETTTGASS